MQFNSYIFIFFFLPLTLVGFYQIAARRDRQAAMMWLVIMSLIFYSWWNVNYLGLFCFSMFLNFTLGSALTGDLDLPLSRPWLLRLGIFFNLGLLAYFKYAGLTVASINGLLGTEFKEPSVLLPLAISFFTFQQIAYLVDTFRGKVKELSFVNYCLFISFFPQLIAGPIVYYRELIPQFLRREGAATNASGKTTFRCNPEDIIVGLTLFSMGLFKKAVFADSLSP
ncbi:MAG: MBOAT family protein, partial [Cyanobacteria bacterium P01_H01_bin.15]